MAEPARVELATRSRDISVDTLRGVACVLLVAYHVADGLRASDGLLTDANTTLGYIRMPLFTFLSGLVYAWRPYNADLRGYLRGKSRRLLVPLIVVGTAFAVIQSVNPASNDQVTDWSTLHLIPVGHFWYLEALFWIFLVMIPLERTGLLSTRTGTLAALGAAGALGLAWAGTGWLAIGHAIQLLPFFLAGLYVSRFGLRVRHERALGIASLVALVTALWVFPPAGAIRPAAALAAGLIASAALFLIRLRSRPLAWLGKRSYTVFLFHVFFSAAARQALVAAGVGDLWVQLAAGVLVGVAGPVLVDELGSRATWSRVLLLGRSPLPATVATPVATAPQRSAPPSVGIAIELPAHRKEPSGQSAWPRAAVPASAPVGDVP